ncbi:MAG: diadenylate cyclase [Candidatus Binatia bacterium]
MGTTLNPFSPITVAEIIDIVVVAVLLYTVIVWARRTRAAFIIRGIVILGGIYIIARQLELQMTAWIFQGFFAVFLVLIVVIFQEEIRQMFERIAVWSLTHSRTPALGSTTVNVLVRAIVDFTKEHTGALIVIRGNDPLERHLTGGIALDGNLSEPLLKSLFDPSSPGHDGAVVVENNQISRFAVHLPLSRNTGQLAPMGTRHRAALGLAELTDALCIAISEERGIVSVARDSRMKEVENFQEIQTTIQKFLNDKFPTEEPGTGRTAWLSFFRKNWMAKAVAVSLAVGFWYVFVPGSKIVAVSYEIPVTIQNLPSDLQVEEVEPTAVSATFTGPRRAFYLFEPQRLRVTVDVSLAELGRRTFSISEQNIRYPEDLTLQQLKPSTVRLSVRKIPSPSDSSRG